MNCLECRRLTLINPLDNNPVRLRHLETCDGCGAFADQLLRQDDLIREATQVGLPDGFAARILLNQSLQSTPRRPARRYWLSLAATVLLAIVLGPMVIDTTVYRPFENELIAHMNKHDMLANANHIHVAEPEEIASVLRVVDTALPSESGSIIAATTCIVDGKTMAHLLMERSGEQFVVFVIPQRSVIERSFTNNDWAGQIVKVDHRSLAVLNHDGANLSPASSHFAQVLSRPLTSG